MKHSARRIFFFSYTSHVAGHHKFMEIFVPRKQLHNCGIFTYQEQKSQQQAVSDQVPILTEKKIHTYRSRQTYSTNWQLPQKQQHQCFCDICRIHRSSNTRINITFLQEKTTGCKQCCGQSETQPRQTDQTTNTHASPNTKTQSRPTRHEFKRKITVSI